MILSITSIRGINDYTTRNCNFCKRHVKAMHKDTIYLFHDSGYVTKVFPANQNSKILNNKYMLHSKACESCETTCEKN